MKCHISPNAYYTHIELAGDVRLGILVGGVIREKTIRSFYIGHSQVLIFMQLLLEIGRWSEWMKFEILSCIHITVKNTKKILQNCSQDVV